MQFCYTQVHFEFDQETPLDIKGYTFRGFELWVASTGVQKDTICGLSVPVT